MKKRIPYTKQPNSSFKDLIKISFFVLLIFSFQAKAFAQNDSQEIITVKGVVTEAEFGAVIGANII